MYDPLRESDSLPYKIKQMTIISNNRASMITNKEDIFTYVINYL